MNIGIVATCICIFHRGIHDLAKFDTVVHIPRALFKVKDINKDTKKCKMTKINFKDKQGCYPFGLISTESLVAGILAITGVLLLVSVDDC